LWCNFDLEWWVPGLEHPHKRAVVGADAGGSQRHGAVSPPGGKPPRVRLHRLYDQGTTHRLGEVWPKLDWPSWWRLSQHLFFQHLYLLLPASFLPASSFAPASIFLTSIFICSCQHLFNQHLHLLLPASFFTSIFICSCQHLFYQHLHLLLPEHLTNEYWFLYDFVNMFILRLRFPKQQA